MSCLDAVNLLLAEEAETLRERSPWSSAFILCIILGLGVLDSTQSTSGSLRTYSCRLQHWQLGHALCHPWCHLTLPRWQSGPNLYLWLAGWAPKQHRPLSPHPSPEGHDFLSALFVLKQSGVKIKPPRGPAGQCPLHPASLPSVALRSLSGLPPIWVGRRCQS